MSELSIVLPTEDLIGVRTRTTTTQLAYVPLGRPWNIGYIRFTLQYYFYVQYYPYAAAGTPADPYISTTYPLMYQMRILSGGVPIYSVEQEYLANLVYYKTIPGPLNWDVEYSTPVGVRDSGWNIFFTNPLVANPGLQLTLETTFSFGQIPTKHAYPDYTNWVRTASPLTLGYSVANYRPPFNTVNPW